MVVRAENPLDYMIVLRVRVEPLLFPRLGDPSGGYTVKRLAAGISLRRWYSGSQRRAWPCGPGGLEKAGASAGARGGKRPKGGGETPSGLGVRGRRRLTSPFSGEKQLYSLTLWGQLWASRAWTDHANHKPWCFWGR